MATPNANVSSIEALDSFRSSMVVYLEKAGSSLDEINQEVRRTRHWLHDEQVHFWKKELRKRIKALDLANSEYFSARLTHSGSTGATGKQAAVRRAKEAKREAEDKLRMIKKWRRVYDSEIEPLAKKVEQLRASMLYEKSNAISFLEQTALTLSDYAGMRKSGTAASKPESEEETES